MGWFSKLKRKLKPPQDVKDIWSAGERAVKAEIREKLHELGISRHANYEEVIQGLVYILIEQQGRIDWLIKKVENER